MIERNGDRLLLRGSVTLADVLVWREAGCKEIDRDKLTIDLSGIEEADSSALSLLLEWQRFAKSRGFQLDYVNMPEKMRSLAEVYGVLDMIALDRTPAVAAAAPS
jgi:phospholipid transport system transporter-binding protein